MPQAAQLTAAGAVGVEPIAGIAGGIGAGQPPAAGFGLGLQRRVMAGLAAQPGLAGGGAGDQPELAAHAVPAGHAVEGISRIGGIVAEEPDPCGLRGISAGRGETAGTEGLRGAQGEHPAKAERAAAIAAQCEMQATNHAGGDGVALGRSELVPGLRDGQVENGHRKSGPVVPRDDVEKRGHGWPPGMEKDVRRGTRGEMLHRSEGGLLGGRLVAEQTRERARAIR